VPKISVLIPVYNTKEAFLRESVESILNQTFQEFELIIVDDGSVNDVEAVINSYEDKRIKFYKNEKNLGVAKTRNRLLDLAKGEYCAFQDADDISYPERLKKQAEFLDKNHEISIVGTDLERFPSKKIITNPTYPKLFDFIGGCAISQGTSMFRLEDLKKNNLRYDEDLLTSEDYDLWSRAVLVLNFANINEPLLKYRRVGTSLCHSKNDTAYGIDKKIKQRLLDYLTNDSKLQKEILKTVSKYSVKKASFAENIFSVRNEWHGEKKAKILTLLGLKIRIK